jgi:VWFA-related protein
MFQVRRYILPMLPVLFAAAQEQKFRTDVNQVLVPVVVTDEKGHRVANLHAEDFELLEDGAAQKILSFSAGTEALPAALDAPVTAGKKAKKAGETAAPFPASDAPAVRRTYAICVDTLHSSFENFPPVRKALENFFEHEQRTDSEYWLISLGKKPEVLQYPTSDPRAMLIAIRAKSFLATVQNSEASALGTQISAVRRQLDDYCGRCPCGRSTRPIPMECVGPKKAVEGLVSSSAERTQIFTEFYLKELRAVVDDLSHMPGSRTMILISDGFNLVPGRELYGVMKAYFPNDDRWQLNDRDTTAHLEPILRMAAANNITVYGLNSSGLGSSGGAGAVFQASNNGPSTRGAAQTIMPQINTETARVTYENGTTMAALAKATGGVFIENSNALLSGIQRAFSDTRDYYVLGYIPSNEAMDGTYRTITVKVKDTKASVRAKAGYWASR